MGQREDSKTFDTEEKAQKYADRVKASATPGYSEVYVSGPYLASDGLWHVNWKEYYG